MNPNGESFERGRYSNDGTMSVNGLSVVLNMPPALKQRFVGGKEVAQELPPYNVRPAFKVDDYEAAPANWMRGGPDAASFFVPVREGHGLWLDFNANHAHTHHVAVVISVQGINTISGLEAHDPFLEQYRERCPKHDKPLGEGRFCEECGYMWNPQNYLAGNATPRGMFWLDGFWAEDGVTRQYILTEDELRGVASQVIGDKAVFAIGIAFFLSKEPKPVPKIPDIMRFRGAIGTHHFLGSVAKGGGVAYGLPIDELGVHKAIGGYDDEPVAMAEALMSVGEVEDDRSLLMESTGEDRTFEEAIEEKSLHVGAGAKIDQKIHQDPEKLSFWQPRPAGIVYINYVGEATARMILSKGKKDRTAGGEGWMNGLEVGNPAE
jgi:hypothetical protein